MKNTDISERLLEMIDYLGVTKNEFAKNLSYDRSQAVYDMINGKSKPSFDFFNRLLHSEYSELFNIEYLISGIGSLHKPNIQNKLYNESITKSITFSDKTKSAKNVTHLIEDPLGVPLIPVDAMAGFGTGDFQVMEYETSRYLVPEFTELAVDFMIRVKGSSMQPKYNSGDLVACKKLETACVFFQWNKVYVLATVQGALIKRIKKGKDDDHVLIISDNPAYDPFELNKSEIKAIAIVCGVIRLE